MTEPRWYASPGDRPPLLRHLLTEESPHLTMVCGVYRYQWRPIEAFKRADLFAMCPECALVAASVAIEDHPGEKRGPVVELSPYLRAVEIVYGSAPEGVTVIDATAVVDALLTHPDVLRALAESVPS